MEITINAPELETHPGTTGFVMTYLAKAKLSVQITKHVNIVLFLKGVNEENWYLVCMYCLNPNHAIYSHYESHGEGYYAKYERKGLFGSLKPAGKALVAKFISVAAELTRYEWVESAHSALADVLACRHVGQYLDSTWRKPEISVL